jgi:1-aminocyclopropane-1-carboxylate deaminase
MELFNNIRAPIQSLTDEITRQYNVSLAIKREDLNHPDIVGNKLRKLKYNILAAKQKNKAVILSFGGAYSNHILALSAAGKIFNIPTIGVIRGEELQNAALNPVLSKAKANGMRLSFITREQYKRKNESAFIENLHNTLGDFYLIPEGGSNELGVKGAAEILEGLEDQYDVIVCATGTGGTLAGLIQGAHDYGLQPNLVAGISVLKENSPVRADIIKLLPQDVCQHVDWLINTDYHFGGYAKTNQLLLDFIRWFKTTHGIDLDYIYTGKMMFGIYNLIQSGSFTDGCRILAIHTGGTQTASVDK